MIPIAREVWLKLKRGKMLEAHCRVTDVTVSLEDGSSSKAERLALASQTMKQLEGPGQGKLNVNDRPTRQ
jgi:hypothetical protein